MNEDVFYLGLKALFRNKEGKLLLLKENSLVWDHPCEPFWDIPGGRMNRGENIEKALRREVFEESGITEFKICDRLHFVFSKHRIPIADSDVGVILSAYICEASEGVELVLSDEHLESGWFSPAEASELLKVRYPEEFTEQIAKL